MNEINSTKDNVEFLTNRVDELNEKLYDFEQSKRNNLIFYGVPNENRETPSVLLQKVKQFLNINIVKKKYLFSAGYDHYKIYLDAEKGDNNQEGFKDPYRT